MKVAIIGQGYVGLTVGLFASCKNDVVGYDLNERLVSQLNSGVSHIEGLSSERLQKALKNGSYRATTVPSELDGAEIIIIAVPTPLTSDRKPDLKYIEKACKVVGDHVTNPALIINESTSYPGTVRNFIKPRIEQLNQNVQHEYAVSPERVDPGRVDWDQTNTARLYSGLTQSATSKTKDFYSTFCNNLVEVSAPEVAEAAKLFENTFRQVNIALVNEFAQISHALNIPVREVLDAANTKPYGFMKFHPSAGVGGHCIPVDPSYLAEVAEEHGVKARFIKLANEVNIQMGSYVVKRVKSDNGDSLKGKKVQVIGVSYKPNIADVRETPAEQIIEALKIEDAIITWHDPLVSEWQGMKSSQLGSEIGIVVTLHEVLNQKDIISKFNYVFDTTGNLTEATQL